RREDRTLEGTTAAATQARPAYAMVSPGKPAHPGRRISSARTSYDGRQTRIRGGQHRAVWKKGRPVVTSLEGFLGVFLPAALWACSLRVLGWGRPAPRTAPEPWWRYITEV